MDTMNGPADFLQEPVSLITGTKFENAKSTKMVHITEFTADLIRHGKLNLIRQDDNRSRHSMTPVTLQEVWVESRVTSLTACATTSMKCRKHHQEQTFCWESGSGLNAGEIEELRMLGELPRQMP